MPSDISMLKHCLANGSQRISQWLDCAAVVNPGKTKLPAVIVLLPSVYSMLLLAPTTLPGSPGGQLCVLVWATIAWNSSPNSETTLSGFCLGSCIEVQWAQPGWKCWLCCSSAQLSWVCQQYQTAFTGQRDNFSDSYSSSFSRNLHPVHCWADSADYRTKMAWLKSSVMVSELAEGSWLQRIS